MPKLPIHWCARVHTKHVHKLQHTCNFVPTVILPGRTRNGRSSHIDLRSTNE